MYKIYIPVYNQHFDEKWKESLVRQLKKAKADAVFLTFCRILRSEKALAKELAVFNENKDFLTENGFSVGAWIAPTIGYGSSGSYDNDAENVYTRLKSTTGLTAKGAFCPLDKGFVADFMKTVRAVCSTGVNTILLEDDYRLTGGKGISGLCCCCDEHLRRYRKLVGDDITRDALHEKLVCGGPGKYRDAWIELQSETLKAFTSGIEKAVHAKDKDIRIGICASDTAYDLECVPLTELVKIISGGTKPFVRLTGAPYWKNLPTFATNIEAERVQLKWFENTDITLITEGDTYPRPRSWVPSAFLEGFDMVLRACGGSDGILKYMLDYTSSANYESGYVDRHARNESVYAEIARRFSGKKAVGLRIFENMCLFRDKTYGEDSLITDFDYIGNMPYMSSWLTADNSIPTTYDAGAYASLIFGENAKHVTSDMLKNGVVIDAQAAKILTENGIDTGILSFEKVPNPISEYFADYGETTVSNIDKEGRFYSFTLKPGAKVLSEFISSGSAGLSVVYSSSKAESKRFPSCFTYENALGERFAVYSFVPSSVCTSSGWAVGLYRNYCRQRQLADAIKWLQRGKPLPAMCFGNPQLYILCKKDDNSMAVGLWNFFPDTVFTPDIFLDDKYEKADFYNCAGALEGDKIKLSTDIIPYGFAFFTVYK